MDIIFTVERLFQQYGSMTLSYCVWYREFVRVNNGQIINAKFSYTDEYSPLVTHDACHLVVQDAFLVPTENSWTYTTFSI